MALASRWRPPASMRRRRTGAVVGIMWSALLAIGAAAFLSSGVLQLCWRCRCAVARLNALASCRRLHPVCCVAGKTERPFRNRRDGATSLSESSPSVGTGRDAILPAAARAAGVEYSRHARSVEAVALGVLSAPGSRCRFWWCDRLHRNVVAAMSSIPTLLVRFISSPRHSFLRRLLQRHAGRMYLLRRKRAVNNGSAGRLSRCACASRRSPFNEPILRRWETSRTFGLQFSRLPDKQRQPDQDTAGDRPGAEVLRRPSMWRCRRPGKPSGQNAPFSCVRV